MKDTQIEQLAEEIVAGLKVEIKRLLSAIAKPDSRPGFAHMEFLIRRLLLRKAREVMQAAVEMTGTGYEGASVVCACGGRLRFVDYREKYIKTILGEVNLRRAYYHCKECGRSLVPLDEELELEKGHASPALRRVVSLAGITGSFYKAPELLREIGEIEVNAKQVQRITEQVAAGVEDVEETCRLLPELEKTDRAYISCDGAMVNTTEGWRETKIGAIYNDGDDPKRYLARIREAGQFGAALRREGARVGVWSCEEAIFIGDGAPWIREQARINFPQAVQIVDFYHVKEHITECANKLFGEGRPRTKRWRSLCVGTLYKRGAGRLISLLGAEKYKRRKAVKELLKYILPNKDRMRYPEYRARGWQIGSGPVESACKQIVSQRLKLNGGMRWRVENAEAIARLRCLYLSNAWEAFWQMLRAA
jgi:hypothetical protein